MDVRKRYYVYSYADPITKEPFYIGKGCGGRSAVHLKCSIYDCNIFKVNKIKKLTEGGTPPIVSIVQDKLTEEEAFALETSLIQKYGRRGIDFGGVLTNRVFGPVGVASSTQRSKSFSKPYKITRRSLYKCTNPEKSSDTFARRNTKGVTPLTQEEIDTMCRSSKLTRPATQREQIALMTLPVGYRRFAFRP